LTSCAYRIHENPLGDEGMEKLLSGLLALHGGAGSTPDGTTDSGVAVRDETTAGSEQSVIPSDADHRGDAVDQTSSYSQVNTKSLEIGACGMTPGILFVSSAASSVKTVGRPYLTLPYLICGADACTIALLH